MIVAGRLAIGGALVDGWVEVEGVRIRARGNGSPPRPPDLAHAAIVAPGLCDLQVNGACGVEVTGGPAALDTIDRLMLARGVTSYLPTIVSTDPDVAARAVAELTELAAEPRSPVAGIHLEGPFLSPDHAGVHPRRWLRTPSEGVPSYFASPAVRMVTLAPELEGAPQLISELCARGVAVALGHSGAGAAQAARAVDLGARAVTHVFNAMAPLHHRAPGLAGVALTDERVSVGVIADGRHVSAQVLEVVRRCAGPRAFLVTDATPAAGAPPGRYRMAQMEIDTSAGDGPRTSDGRLAGGDLTLDAAMRLWTSLTQATRAEALAAASDAPRAAVSLPVGLEPGNPADMVVLDDDGHVMRVMRRGRWVEPGASG